MHLCLITCSKFIKCFPFNADLFSFIPTFPHLWESVMSALYHSQRLVQVLKKHLGSHNSSSHNLVIDNINLYCYRTTKVKSNHVLYSDILWHQTVLNIHHLGAKSHDLYKFMKWIHGLLDSNTGHAGLNYYSIEHFIDLQQVHTVTYGIRCFT